MWLAILPPAVQVRLLARQPNIERVICVDIGQVANLSYAELRGRLDRRSLRFDWPLADWEDSGETHHLIRDLEAGVLPAETEEYRRLMELVERGERPKGASTPEQVLEYIEGVRALVERVRRQGIETPGRRGDRGIQVCIDENGRLCKVWGGGTHRYGIARSLQLGRVPVYVRHAHARWLERAVEEEPRSPLRAVERAIQSLAAE